MTEEVENQLQEIKIEEVKEDYLKQFEDAAADNDPEKKPRLANRAKYTEMISNGAHFTLSNKQKQEVVKHLTLLKYTIFQRAKCGYGVHLDQYWQLVAYEKWSAEMICFYLMEIHMNDKFFKSQRLQCVDDGSNYHFFIKY